MTDQELRWTQERIKRFWEACGFKYLPIRPLPDKEPHPTLRYWLYPDGAASNEQLSITDLKALEKWALPTIDGYMIFTGEGGVHAVASKNELNYEAVAETIALALAGAIEKAIIDENRTPEDS